MVESVFDAEDEVMARCSTQVTKAATQALGVDPVLVTDPDDGVTRPTWTVEVPFDELKRICDESNRRWLPPNPSAA